MDNEQEIIKLGIVGIKNVGVYDADTTYKKLNVVTYQGSTYCALKDTLGNLPTNTEYWQLYAEKGGQGDEGPQGPKPVKGTDYFTEEDITSIENDLEPTIASDVSDEVTSQLSSLTSATPLGASSISGMTDTSRIYVLETDGHWYWYNGSEWRDGGVYQATLIGKNKVSMYNLDSYINNSVDGLYSNITGTLFTKGKYIQTNGTEATGNETKYMIISAPLNGGEKLKLKTNLRSNDFGTSYPAAIYIIYDENNNIISKKEETLTTTYNNFTEEVEVPENGRLIKINCYPTMSNYLINATTYKQKEKISYNDLTPLLKDKFRLIYGNKLNPSLFIQNGYVSMGISGEIQTLNSANGFKVYKVPITPKKNYVLKNAIGFSNKISYGIGNNCVNSYSLDSVDYDINTFGDYYNSNTAGSGTLLDDIYFTAPDFATYMYINTSSLNENIFELYEESGLEDTTIFNTNDILYRKKYVACGDSFTHGDFTGYSGEQSDIYDSELQMYKTYPYWIGKRNNMTIINAGINGSIMALSKEYLQGTQPINYKQPFSYERYQQIPLDADYITIMFGLNDMYHTNLGTINDTTNETFYGSGNVVLEWLLRNRPNAKIGIIITNSYLSSTYRQALQELAIKWGVGYLDLYNDTSISKTLSGNGMCETAIQIRNSQYYVTSSNHHPNVKAHIIMSHAIENFLRKL